MRKTSFLRVNIDSCSILIPPVELGVLVYAGIEKKEMLLSFHEKSTKKEKKASSRCELPKCHEVLKPMMSNASLEEVKRKEEEGSLFTIWRTIQKDIKRYEGKENLLIFLIIFAKSRRVYHMK